MIDAAKAALRSAVTPAVLALVGLVLGILADPTAPRAPLFAAASLVALGRRPALVFAALALVAGLGTAPSTASGPASGLVGALGAGVALGLLGRALAAAGLPDALGRAPRIALAALGLALALMLPDGWVQLAGPSGPLTFDALLVDPGTASRVLVPIAARVPHAPPLADLGTLALVLAGVTAVAALAMAALREQPDAILRAVARGTSALGILVSFMALSELALGSVALDGPALREALSLVGRAPVLDLAVPPEADLALWSRPMVDGLRLVAALLLFGATLAPRAAPAAPAQARRSTPALAWLALALAAASLALLLVTPGLALAGGLAVGLGALVVGRVDPRGDLVVRLALLLVLVLWVWGALAAPPIGG